MPERPSERRPVRRLSRRTRLAAASVTAALALVGAGLAVTSPATAVPPVPCDKVTKFVWDGALGDHADVPGDGTSWSDANNWDTDCVPGERFPLRPYDAQVTIPATANVLLGNGESAHVATLVNHGSLTVDHATLETRGSSTSHTLTLTNGFLVGRGQFQVTSLLDLTRSTQASRQCAFAENMTDCAGPVAAGNVGTTVIAPGARMVLRGYLNVKDQRVIDNRGTVTLAGNNGLIAADDGTLFRNRGSFRILNDRGYYQGVTPVQDFGRSQFLNTGVVQKSTAAGVSVIDADFKNSDPKAAGTGQVSVQSGVLSVASLGTTATRRATVAAGATLGNGGPEGCSVSTAPPPASCSQVVPTDTDQTLTTVRVPHRTATSIQELGPVPDPASGWLTAPVEIETPNASATPSTPLRFTILIDSTQLGTNTRLQVARKSPVQRRASATSPWVTLPNCGATQRPTLSKPTCVARTLSEDETTALGGGDAAIVIRSLQNSRYRVGA